MNVWSDKGKQDKKERIKGTMKVVEASLKAQDRRLQCYGDVRRIEEDYVGGRVIEMDVQGRLKRGKPRLQWNDQLNKDFSR